MKQRFDTFAALRSVMNGRTVFSLFVPAQFAAERFALEGGELPEDLRAGRFADEARENAWESALKNAEHFAPFPPIVCALVGKVNFDQATGKLAVARDAVWVAQCGRNFLAALRKVGAAGRGNAAVIVYPEKQPESIQSAFRILQHRGDNTRSRKILASRRDAISEIAHALVSSDSPFAGITELHKSTLAPRSRHLFTLSAVYLATKSLLAGFSNLNQDESLALARDFWKTAAAQFPQWSEVERGEISSGEVRATYLHAHGVVLHALGKVGNQLIKQRPKGWRNALASLGQVDWRRSNARDWEGRALIGGKVAKTTANVSLVTVFMKTLMRLELTDGERVKESAMKRGKE